MLTEKDWSVLESCTPYEKSKLLAEQSAWEFVKNLSGTIKQFEGMKANLLNFFFKLIQRISKSDNAYLMYYQTNKSLNWLSSILDTS